MTASATHPHRLALVIFAVVALLPLGSVGLHGSVALADPYSELPVKLWAFETFLPAGGLGADVTSIGWPNTGPLNNPDLVGTLVTGLLRPLVGRIWAYNLLVVLQLFATMCTTYWMLLEFVRHRAAAIGPAVAFALTPLALMYCVEGAVTDMLNLWPYALAVRSAWRALRHTGWKDGALAGVWLGLAFVSCPYNFLVFSIMALPLAPWLPALWWWGPGAHATPRLPIRGRLVAVFALVVTLGCVAGAYGLQMREITTADRSQMSEALIASTRHSAPWTFLQPGHRDRYTAYLVDYVAIGKWALITREAGSRYFRAFSPGLIVLTLSVVGLVRRRRALWGAWASVAVFCAVVSTGPFLPVGGGIALSEPANYAYLFVHDLWPGGELLLEPFRYGLAVAFALSVTAAIGMDVVMTVGAGGPWLGWLVVPAVLAELVWVSPVPYPLLVADFSVPAGYDQLDALLPPGAIVELPYFDAGTDRFRRVHFLYQLVHTRPIADEVMGFPARYLVQNQFLASLVADEKVNGRLRVEVTGPNEIAAGRARLSGDGFAAIVVDPAHYRTTQERQKALADLRALGEPTAVGALLVYRTK